MNILLAIDGSPFSRKMLAYVASNGLWFRPEFSYTVLHVCARVPTSSSDPAVGVVSEAVHFLRDQIGLQPARALRAGKPAEVIPEFARQAHCNLIVMGSHGYSGIESLMLGSVTQGVLASSHVPVLVVR